jgi:hypothetical protein
VEDPDTCTIEMFTLASISPCKYLDLHVQMDEYNSKPRTVRFLCLLSKALEVRDICLRIWRMPGLWQDYLELLIQGDYIAPTLQSQAPAENNSWSQI